MSIRNQINADLKQALKAKDSERLGTLRLINAAIKDRDIEARGQGATEGVDDAGLLVIMARMVKQRQESARVYEEGGRLELAEKELSEIKIIEDYLPKQLSDAEVDAAISEAIAETGASSLRDMGKVMAVLKTKFTGQLDFGKAGGLVKAKLG